MGAPGLRPRQLGELGATRVTFGPGLQRRSAELLATLTGDLRKCGEQDIRPLLD
ncbi:hypothetical protein [Streptomyces adelaidensis]|uniref:hypothetical protein n=1 Tax=Streptomyces adelaidensis TaxID=2796465 RepID=UPI001904470B|nr:hypothetical protein [Streptomyces adelaidensis]